jgi:hypothetical protein
MTHIKKHKRKLSFSRKLRTAQYRLQESLRDAMDEHVTPSLSDDIDTVVEGPWTLLFSNNVESLEQQLWKMLGNSVRGRHRAHLAEMMENMIHG